MRPDSPSVQEDEANSREMKNAIKINAFCTKRTSTISALIRTVLHLKRKRSATKSATRF